MKRPRIFRPLFEKVEQHKEVANTTKKTANKKKQNEPTPPSPTEERIKKSIAAGEITEEEASIIPELEPDTMIRWGHMNYVDGMLKMRDWIDAGEWAELGNYLVDKKKYNPIFTKTVRKRFSTQYKFTEYPPRYEEPWPAEKFEALAPHLLCEYSDSINTYQFGLMLCWRPRFTKHGLSVLSKVQFVRFKLFEQETGIPVFMIFAIGGTAEEPERFFQIPLRHMENNFVPKPIALRNEHDINKNFYYIPEVKRIF